MMHCIYIEVQSMQNIHLRVPPPLFFDQKLDFELSIMDDSPKCYLQLETSLDQKELTDVKL